MRRSHALWQAEEFHSFTVADSQLDGDLGLVRQVLKALAVVARLLHESIAVGRWICLLCAAGHSAAAMLHVFN